MKKIQVKKNVSRGIVLLILMFVMVASFLFAFRQNLQAQEEVVYLEVTVQKGDTLWAIARDNLPTGYDIREYLWIIQRDNQIEGAIIFPGQVLLLPYN